MRRAANHPPRACVECDAFFRPRSGNALTCSPTCGKRRSARQAAEWVARNPERRREVSRSYSERHPKRRKQTLDEWWMRLRADPARYARFLAQGRESYARHPETGYLYALNWRGENRERVRAINRKASKERWPRMAEGNRQEVADYAQVLRRDPCAYCGRPASVIDHIIALADGGEHGAENLTGACRSCNASKHTRPLLMFLLVGRQRQEAKAAVSDAGRLQGTV